MSAGIAEIAARFAKAVSGQADPGLIDILAPKVVSTHAYDEEEQPMDAAAIVAGLNHDPDFKRLMPDFHATAPRVYCGEDGFAITRTISGTLKDGTKITYPFCAIATVTEGKITRMVAYQDRQQAAPLGAAMMALLQPA